MQTEKPRGPKNMKCPAWKKRMYDVCHSCGFWAHIRGKNPNSGEEFDNYNCAIAWTPVLMIENSAMQRETGSAVESFRNVFAEGIAAAQQSRLTDETHHRPKR